MRFPWQKKPDPNRAYGWTCNCCGWRAVFRTIEMLQTNVDAHVASDWHRENAAKA